MAITRTSLDLTERVALVTGAAQGLGRAHALTLARRGARVVAVDVMDVAPVVAEIAAAGGNATGCRADLRDPESCDRVIGQTLEAFGDLDIVVNNAGVVRDRMSFNLTLDDWCVVLDVNLTGSFLLAQGAIRHWRANSAGHERSIVNTTSESGLYGNVGQANYAAAKAGVAALTVTLASEVGRYGIRVNAIAPRARTPMSDGAFGDLPRTAAFDPFAPEHVADVVAWLASDEATGVTGQVLVVHGAGIEVLRPWAAHRRLERTGPWTESDLAGLRQELFPDGATRQVAAPVRDLFHRSQEEGVQDVTRR